MTVEDPIEYELPDANQSEVDEKGGLTSTLDEIRRVIGDRVT